MVFRFQRFFSSGIDYVLGYTIAIHNAPHADKQQDKWTQDLQASMCLEKCDNIREGDCVWQTDRKTILVYRWGHQTTWKFRSKGHWNRRYHKNSLHVELLRISGNSCCTLVYFIFVIFVVYDMLATRFDWSNIVWFRLNWSICRLTNRPPWSVNIP